MGVTFSAKQRVRIRDVLARIYGLRRAGRLYPPGHPAVLEARDRLTGVILEFHGEGVDVPLTFFEDELLLGDQVLPQESMLFDQLIRELSATGAASIVFKRGLDAEEMLRAVPILTADSAAVERAGGMQALVASCDTPHVEVDAVTVMDGAEAPAPGKEREAAKETYGSAVTLLREIESALRLDRGVGAGQVKGVVRSLIDSVLNNRYAMLELSGLKSYDEYTFFHSVNVSILSLALGSALSHDRRFLSALGVGALLHDIGKLGIPATVLNKPGALNSEEWSEVREHPIIGAELAASMPGLDKAALVLILEHHMRFDLQGYPPPPEGGRPQRLPSRIVAIADAYDAMTSRRVYSAPRLRDEAMAILVQNMDGAFDPALIRLFVGIMGVYPPRSVVRLDTGEVGVVLRANLEHLSEPVVRLFTDGQGNFVEPRELDLSDADAALARSIESCLDPARMNVDVEDYL